MGLIGGMARTAVVAGTATTVSNRVSRRQANRWSKKDQAAYAEQQPQAQPQYAQRPPPQYAQPAPQYAQPAPQYAQPAPQYVQAAATHPLPRPPTTCSRSSASWPSSRTRASSPSRSSRRRRPRSWPRDRWPSTPCRVIESAHVGCGAHGLDHGHPPPSRGSQERLDPGEHCGDVDALAVGDAGAVAVRHVGVHGQHGSRAARQIGTPGVTEAGSALALRGVSLRRRNSSLCTKFCDTRLVGANMRIPRGQPTPVDRQRVCCDTP